jgi:N,N'-diacetyllegionaminate synthase
MNFNRIINIGNREISDVAPVFIIAEAGVNHNGDMKQAKQLVDVAADSGVDAVKFQAFKTENLILENVQKAPYQKKTTGAEETQFEMLKKLEITKEQNLELISYCKKKDILFLSTPFDEESIDELAELNVPAFKVASTDTTNLPFLKKLAQKGKPIFLSTGMSYLSEVEAALQEIYPYNQDVVLLQCTANYPIKDSEANLNVIYTYQSMFDAIVGYSDHSVGIGASPYAVPMGARVLEKHFTLDNKGLGPDHRASLTPPELKMFVKEVRKVEEYLGSFSKSPSFDEQKIRKSLQKCLVAAEDIKKGSGFTEKNIVAKRTGGEGISPIYYQQMISKVATRDYTKNEIIDE